MTAVKPFFFFRIRSHSETRQRRMTRSSEDLTRNSDATSTISEPNDSPIRHRRTTLFQGDSIERSPSCYHVSNTIGRVSSGTNNRDTIILPKNYNPLSQLTALENLHSFKGKTFHEIGTTCETSSILLDRSGNENIVTGVKNYGYQSVPTVSKYEEDGNSGFTNRIFSEAFEAQTHAGMAKEGKMLMNLKQKRQLQKQVKKNLKQITAENRSKDLQILGVLILEIFLPGKMRAHGSCLKMSLEQRIGVCESILKNETRLIPGCVLYPLQLLFGMTGNEKEVTDKGLPMPNAEQYLESILSNILFPFPTHYFKVYAIMKMLYNFNSIGKMLDLYAFFECDGKQCAKFETLDKTRIAFNRKLAECKVRSCVGLIESLLQPSGHEQFNAVQLLLPHVIDLIDDEETSILAAWYLFDIVATALGPDDSQKYLLSPILSLYELETEDQFRNTSMRLSSATTFKSRKAVKLYHHSFLLKLIVRFGLKSFLENFVPPLIEAVGGYRDPQINQPYHIHTTRNPEIRLSRSVSKKLRYSENADVSETTLISPSDEHSIDIDEKTLSATTPDEKQEDVFVFEPESPATDEIETNPNAIQTILDQLDIKSETGSFELKLNYSSAFEVTEDEPFNSDSLSRDFQRRMELNSIGCEIGSKRSFDSIDIFSENLTNKAGKASSEATTACVTGTETDGNTGEKIFLLLKFFTLLSIFFFVKFTIEEIFFVEIFHPVIIFFRCSFFDENFYIKDFFDQNFFN